MKTKFDGILTNEDKDLIVGILSAISLKKKHKINFIESIMTILYTHEDYFKRLTQEEKIKALSLLTIVFDTLTDAEINPLASKSIIKGLMCYNNNVLDIADSTCPTWDEQREQCALENMEKILQTPYRDTALGNYENCFIEQEIYALAPRTKTDK